MSISNKAEKLLRKISHVKQYKETNNSDSDIIDALLEHDFITGTISNININNGGIEYSYYTITESGQAYLDHSIRNSIRFWVPLVISVLALILSSLSIILSPYFSAYFSHVWGL